MHCKTASCVRFLLLLALSNLSGCGGGEGGSDEFLTHVGVVIEYAYGTSLESRHALETKYDLLVFELHADNAYWYYIRGGSDPESLAAEIEREPGVLRSDIWFTGSGGAR